MKSWQAWVLGIAIIVSSVGSCTVQQFSGRATPQTYIDTTAEVKRGVEVIKNKSETPAASETEATE